jgi:hypothetical protein
VWCQPHEYLVGMNNPWETQLSPQILLDSNQVAGHYWFHFSRKGINEAKDKVFESLSLYISWALNILGGCGLKERFPYLKKDSVSIEVNLSDLITYCQQKKPLWSFEKADGQSGVT